MNWRYADYARYACLSPGKAGVWNGVTIVLSTTPAGEAATDIARGVSRAYVGGNRGGRNAHAKAQRRKEDNHRVFLHSLCAFAPQRDFFRSPNRQTHGEPSASGK